MAGERAVFVPAGTDPASRDLPGVGWLLTRFDPYGMDLEAVRRVVRARP